MVSFRTTFRIGCVFTAFLVALWPIYQYNLDEDLVQINFKHFYTSEDRVYPALTLCWDRTQFSEFNDSTKISSLNGTIMDVSSNHTTLSIEDYVSTIVVTNFDDEKTRFSKSGTGFEARHEVTNRKLATNTILRRYQESRCFAIGIPFMTKKGINSIDVGIKRNIFKKGQIPTNKEIIGGESHFSVGMSYQNQYFPLLRHQERGDQNNRDKYIKICSGFTLNIRAMEILRRRSKPGNPCNDYLADDALQALDDVITKLGCIPEFWDVPSTLPVCSNHQLNTNRQVLDDSLFSYNERHLLKPCRSKLDLWYDNNINTMAETCSDDEDTFHIKVLFNDLTFKEISFVRAYTIWNLLSSLCVIMSLFFGFSLIQLPDLLLERKMMKKLQQNLSLSESKTIKTINQDIELLSSEVEKLRNDVETLKLPIVRQLHNRQFETTV